MSVLISCMSLLQQVMKYTLLDGNSCKIYQIPMFSLFSDFQLRYYNLQFSLISSKVTDDVTN